MGVKQVNKNRSHPFQRQSDAFEEQGRNSANVYWGKKEGKKRAYGRL